MSEFILPRLPIKVINFSAHFLTFIVAAAITAESPCGDLSDFGKICQKLPSQERESHSIFIRPYVRVCAILVYGIARE